jgi:hypothetical protein
MMGGFVDGRTMWTPFGLSAMPCMSLRTADPRLRIRCLIARPPSQASPPIDLSGCKAPLI